ncbi:MAG: MBL fold metallo-hydrolase [Chloroflexota bacterium]
MILKYFYDKKLAQASYMIGCAATGEALVVDPSRDITPYLKAAEAEGLNITHVTETHIHADYVSGTRELATATGARIYLSDMGDENWKYAFADDHTVLLRDGDWWMVGNVRVDVIHTPGHTPEHLAFQITDTAGADRPMGVFTGDFLFVGDVGRPDLLEEAAGIANTREPGARAQFKSVARFKDMPDYLQIWPGHGAGSACGKALGAVPTTTLGYEKLFSPAFQFEDEDTFVAWLLDGQPEAPRYFAQMKKVNKEGPVLLRDVPPATQLDRAAIDAAIDRGELVLDMRSRADYAQAHIAGTMNIPEDQGGCVNYVGWFVDYTEPLYIIAEVEKVQSILNAFRAIGVDNVAGYATPDVIEGQTESLPLIDAQTLANRLQNQDLIIIDVRGKSEYSAMHISGARHIPLGYLPRHLNELPQDQTIVAQCASGYRSQVAASLLRRYGFKNVVNLSEGIDTWSKVLKTEQD